MKIKNKIIIILLTIALLFSSFSIGYAEPAESFAYTLTPPGTITIVWANPDIPYPYAHVAYVTVETDQGLIEISVQYVQRYGDTYYFSTKFCNTGRILSAYLKFIYTEPVYIFGSNLDGMCRKAYLPLLEN